MGSIKPLPEAVRSSVRSAIILFDLTRVVEELIFNSLDASASKVSVFVSVGSSYVKVVDDGSGISRDGLVSLGERYVTSKLYHLGNLDAASRSFGFRGEALASISDVALVEIITKAHGKPNGYRKVIKGSKCLYLGIDDDRKDAGTTVVVRDLFYNQPVRKKHMQSSPKKVLHSVKKCVFRIALVHPIVYFNVIDIESEDELLSTHPSSSPLSLLMSAFGIEDCASLQKLNANDGSLKLSGYITGSCDNFAVKAFQYVYINSRFVCKGPIHKLLNNLATSFESLDPEKANNWTKKGKRSRPQVFPSYILNISCPPSFYDLTFEPSKTCVEFKDWASILAFIEKTIQLLRRKNIHSANGLGQAETLKEDDNILHAEEDFFNEGPSVDSEFATRKCRTQKYQPSTSLEKLTTDHLFLTDHEDIPFEECHGNNAQFRDQQNNMKFVHWTDYSFQSWDDSLVKGTSSVFERSDCCLLTSDNSSLVEDYFLENRFTASGRSNCYVNNNGICSKLGNASDMVESDVTNGTDRSVLPFDYHEHFNDSQFRKNISKPFLQSCSSQRTVPLDRELVENEKGIEPPMDSFKTKVKQVCSNERFNMLKTDSSDWTMWQDGGSCSQIYPKLVSKGGIARDLDVLTRASAKSFLSCGDVPIEENGLPSDSVTPIEKAGSGHQSLSSEWCSVTFNPFEQFSYKNAIEGCFRSEERTNFGHFSAGEDEDNQFSFDLISRSSSQEKCIPDCPNTGLEIDYAKSSRDFRGFLQQYNLNRTFSPDDSNVAIEERDWLCTDLSINEYRSQSNWFQYQDVEQNPVPKERSRRSQSAPPFYSYKRRFISLHHCLATEEPTFSEVRGPFTSPEIGEKKPPQQSSGVDNLCFEPSFGKTRSNMNNKTNMVFSTVVRKCEDIEQPHCLEGPESVPVQVFISKGNRDPANSGTKWRSGFAQNTSNSKLCDIDNEYNVLDIASGLPYVATKSLVPESINKNCLRDAKVLQQLDKKFIPIVAGRTLAVIDQHAADERIRLEELRQQVLSGEGKTVTYLDAEQELILPEIGYQLLHNYSEQIRNWGWICDIHTQDSKPFKKNLNLIRLKPAVIKLLAVPCILGVNLSHVDLLEFLQQLADTDGSSTMPPSIIRILNSKACRGAIMFGDSLLPSECSLIVEELKQTSLCFQCAHGRPTTVPVVNLETLHRLIAKMQITDDGPRELWHGLCRHRVTLERASLRLSAAGG
ncbi:DNA mismatch repair protein MLH3 isoform X4 [Herrania umbratica]|uniref:DNA mismatch repair protein MLH3 isoform X4 n=1 Tax=Herrania umbratica TaxID=108875 RepID=A0A6J0ZLN1_9ROSI|nr:DNA mismatch repair protein MLH3 isoform X4 [Herrania umbratica]